jgi:AraC-like DNA-binding protein
MPHWSLSRPAGSAQLMIGLAEEHGVSVARCIAGTGLTPDDLVDPAREIAGQQELGVLRNILRALDPSVPFGLLAGLRYRATTHGLWGFAIMTSASFRDAIDVGLRHFDLTYSFNRAGFELDGHHAHMLLEDCDNPEDLRAALIERDLGAMVTLQRDALGTTVPLHSLQLRAPRPEYAAAFEPLFGVTPQFGAQVNCVVLDVAVLSASGPLADPRAARVCDELCRSWIEQRGMRFGIAGRVRGRLLRKPGEFPSMNVVAAELGMSTRTLRNRLVRESTSYREIVDQLRQVIAEELLSSGAMTIDAIGQRLGYADTSAFIAAFKRWKGVPPGSYKCGAAR